ncbi:MAG: phage major capsid protein [Solobacterium sp.]|nr:phage major capsid protein [Solobacterium sp.]
MKITSTNDALKQKVTAMIADAEDKNEGVFNAIDMVVEQRVAEANADLVDQIKAEAAAGVRNFRQLTKKEKTFYEALQRGPEAFRQAVTADQIDIIPTETIDYTLANVKEPSGVLALVNRAPAGVKKWLVAEKTGTYAWGKLTDAITGELTATITSLSMDVFKLMAYCVIPKAIRDLEIGYVDRYFTAVLQEALQDGLVYGYLYGDGVSSPIGIFKQIAAVNQDATHQNKAVLTTIKGFSPKQLAPVLTTLSNSGKRKVSKLVLICNPADRYQYVNPALYGDSISGGFVSKSFIDLEVIEDATVTTGQAAFTIPGVYTLGVNAVKVDEYKETKALDDADVVIGKVYANGRAVDDNCAVIFDVTKLEEYIPSFKTVTEE